MSHLLSFSVASKAFMDKDLSKDNGNFVHHLGDLASIYLGLYHFLGFGIRGEEVSHVLEECFSFSVWWSGAKNFISSTLRKRIWKQGNRMGLKITKYISFKLVTFCAKYIMQNWYEELHNWFGWWSKAWRSRSRSLMWKKVKKKTFRLIEIGFQKRNVKYYGK